MTGAVETHAELAREILRRPARLGTVRLVAVDGPSGAGKTTFAAHLASALRRTGARVAVVHTDELLDGWGDQFTFWSRLEATVLEPLRAGRSARHPCYDWVAGRFVGEREVPVPDVLILEGSTTARPAARPELTLAVLVDAPAEERLGRVLARDGPAVEEPLRRWMAAEDRYFAAEAPAGWVDRLVDGAPLVVHDPESGYVRLPRPGDDHG